MSNFFESVILQLNSLLYAVDKADYCYWEVSKN